MNSSVGPLAPDNLEDPVKLRDAVQTVTLLALRAVGVMDARAPRPGGAGDLAGEGAGRA